ncbi:bifunctional folate synthesis protein [bacterium BMS3Abin07]|nr:bifunctional folate synthesis protein [bacterium BMS3Abin07]GBE33210.1 bifunctional folate synthesis protein [bacterium BMS3Bbin05]HDO23244.1 2-amino-4-hydroxy-6-hydroxymethyldihydropteridine diphosphokinase [Nitrospirota bacterium]HDZ88838.1 2-amino-4-hydroxy-6-hydroxymethyldihydropteridine diphosphokinase [Nitrospirota bacterium]
MHDVFIGIGSNIGNREDNCNRVINRIDEAGMEIVSRSSMYETEPWGVKTQPLFINMVIRVRTDADPHDLLRQLQSIEKEMGRQKGPKWAPRVIDLDILLYDDLTVDEPDLKIPHPYMSEREFVLKPLSEIAPDVTRRYTDKY